MKICLISDSYPTLPAYGGIAVFSQLAAHSLAARGHEVHVLVAKAGRHFEMQDGPVVVHGRSVRWLPLVGKWFPGFGESLCLAWWLAALHRVCRFNVIEAPNWEGIGLVPAWLPGIPLVVRLHTSMAESIAVAGRKPSRAERFTIWMEKTSAGLAKAVVTHSEGHRAKLEKDYAIDHVRVIPHGIALRDLSDRGEQENSVLVVGPCNARKGAETLFAAIPAVLAQVPRAKFWLAGIAEDHPRVREFRAKHPDLPADSVRFLGFVDAGDLGGLYGRCAAYASASIYESFGLTFVEAMSWGKAVVGCAVSAMPEIIEDGRTGLLVPPNDPAAFASAIVRLLKDDALRQRLGKEGRRVAEERYSADLMAERIEGFYTAVVASQARKVGGQRR